METNINNSTPSSLDDIPQPPLGDTTGEFPAQLDSSDSRLHGESVLVLDYELMQTSDPYPNPESAANPALAPDSSDNIPPLAKEDEDTHMAELGELDSLPISDEAPAPDVNDSFGFGPELKSPPADSCTGRGLDSDCDGVVSIPSPNRALSPDHHLNPSANPVSDVLLADSDHVSVQVSDFSVIPDQNLAQKPNHDPVVISIGGHCPSENNTEPQLVKSHEVSPVSAPNTAQEPTTELVVASVPDSSVISADLNQSLVMDNNIFGVHVPKKRRRGRSQRNIIMSDQMFRPPPLGSDVADNNASQELSFSVSENGGLKPDTDAVTSATPSRPDFGDEIIVINREATSEALVALSAGFPADILTEEEIDAGVVQTVGGIEQVNYILIRNHIITKWRENTNIWVTKEMFADAIPPHCSSLTDRAYNYLASRGYINFGVSPAIKEKMPSEPTKSNVIVIGAGLAGLAAARQLMRFGFKVTVLEGRKRAGGRVYTRKMEGANKVSAAADLGGTVLTGTLGNPLAILARQLGISLQKIRDKCPLYRIDGSPVDPGLDLKVETAFNKLLEKASKLRLLMGDISMNVSLGASLETYREVYGDAVTDEELGLFNWHLANLEYANAGLLSNLSLAFWDQDDPYDMGGDHCFMPGGNGRVVQALAENVNILYEKTVTTIRYSSAGVQVVAATQVFEGDMALCTVPLGVLKSGSIKFVPELPQRKLDSIKRLGFGLLNKVAMVFPHVFWNTELDTFGHLSKDKSHRGEFFLFYSYATLSGGPLLMALVAGEAAHEFETMPPTDAVTRVIKILKDIFEPQGISVPEPLQTVCTRWGSDSFSLGAYSHVAVGASGDDYDILAENVGDGRLFFAGEATTRRYPATMHGAFLSGLREAASMEYYANVRAMKLKVHKAPSMSAHSCASILADLFREPDLEFGSFSIIFSKIKAGPQPSAILRVTIGECSKKTQDTIKEDHLHSNKLLVQQLKSHFNQQQQLYVYTLLNKQQALELREVRGGDEMRLRYLCDNLGVKLLGRKGLGISADSIVASIKIERSKRRSALNYQSRRSGALNPGTAIQKQKTVRRARIIGNGVAVNGNGLPQGARMVSSGIVPPSRIDGTSSSQTQNSGAGLHVTTRPNVRGEIE